jgi:hypothetical protein
VRCASARTRTHELATHAVAARAHADTHACAQTHARTLTGMHAETHNSGTHTPERFAARVAQDHWHL